MTRGFLIAMRQGFDTKQEFLLNSDTISGRRLMSAVVAKSVDNYPSFTFSLDPSHREFANIRPFTSFVRVVRPDTGKFIFEGRVLTVNDQMDSSGAISKDVTCEGLEGFLHDSVPSFKEFHNTTPKDFLAWLVDQHNTQVENYKQLKLGTVTVTNSTDNVYRFVDETKDTYDNIKEKLIDRLGGEIRVRHANDELFLDYMPTIGETSNQDIVLTRNMVSLARTIDSQSVITVLKPLGATQEPADGSSGGDTTDVSYPRLNISSVNNGSLYLKDQSLIDQFGVHVATQTWDNVTTTSALLSKGQDYLNSQAAINTQLQVGYVDLSLMTPDKFMLLDCGDTVRINNKLQGIDMIQRITGTSLDCLNVASSSITLGSNSMSGATYEAMTNKQWSTEGNQFLSKLRGYQKQLSDMSAATVDQINKLQADIDNADLAGIADLKNLVKELQDQINSDNYYTGSIIDVSEFQGSINWSQVVSGGLALSVIRIQSGSSHIDETYTANIPNAISAGANYAVYAYFSALDANDAEIEARDFYNRATSAIGSRKQPRFWMIDVEKNSVTSGTLSAAVTAYMNKLNALGIPDNKIVIYVSNALYPSINTSRTQIWIPSYGINDGTIANSRKPLYPYDLWQYTSVGRISGISGNVDMSTEPSDRFKKAYLTKG